MEIKDTAMGIACLENQLESIVKKSSAKRKLAIIAAAVALVLLTMVAAWFIGRNQAKQNAAAEIMELKTLLREQKLQIQELIDTPAVADAVSPKINLGIIYSEINEISELATMEYLFTDAAKFTDSKQFKNWNIPFTEKSFILKWNGVIKAGVKLDLVTIEVKEDENKIIVSVPAAEILSYEIDSDSVEVLDEKNNIFNNITVDDKVKFDAATEDAMKQRAIENGLLEKAQKNAENILLRLLQADPAIGSNYTIEFVVAE